MDVESHDPVGCLMNFSKCYAAIATAVFFFSPSFVSAQTPIPPNPPTQATPAVQQTETIGTVATLTGSATVTRNNATTPLRLKDEIFSGDTLRTGPNGALGITLDDETTFNMGASASMVMNNLIYQSGGSSNASLFNVARGTVAFVAGQVAKTGDMKIATPTATLGIRGTTGLIEVPDIATAPGDVAIKLYNDADGRLGRIEVFGVGPNAAQRLGVLDRAASGFSIRRGANGLFGAVALQISPQQAARDRGFVGRLFKSHTLGRRMVIERRNIRQQLQRGPGLQQRGQQLRGPGQQPTQLRGPGQPRNFGQQPLRGPNVLPPGPQQQRRARRPDLDPRDVGPRGSNGPGFRAAPPMRQFNPQRLR